jgi:hypothetical protein
MTIDIGASVMTARSNITTGLPDKDLTQPYFLQMVSGKTLTGEEAALLELILG